MKLLTVMALFCAVLFTGCKKEEFSPTPEATILTIKAQRSNGGEFDDTYAFIWDASKNNLDYDMNATIPFEIKDKAGNKVAAIAMEKMHTSISNSGVISDYIYCILNIDKLVFYDNSKLGKLLICVYTKYKYSNMPRYSFYELSWQREKEYTIQKIFRGDNPLASYEKW